jgi:hypothetical protein
MSLPPGSSNASAAGGGTGNCATNLSATDHLQHSNSQNSMATLASNPSVAPNLQQNNYMRAGAQNNARQRTTTTVVRGTPKDINGDTILILSLINRLGAKVC